MVDFPSIGNDDVKPMILFDLTISLRSIATLIDRIDSAKRENGESTTVQSTLLSRVRILASVIS